MKNQAFNQSLLSFLHNSPTPFHAVDSMKATLLDKGFKELKEKDHWVIEEGGQYFVTRNASSIIAFTTPTLNFHSSGWRMIGGHTDSPCLKLKPNAHVVRSGYHQLGVEIYGGVLLHTWLDRDLSLAGRITLKLDSGERISRLIDFKDPIAVVPNLAIHLNRSANDGFSVNPQEEMLPILGLAKSELELQSVLMKQVRKQHPTLGGAEILDFELSLYDTQAPSLVGLHKEFICSARLDNLLSCFVGLDALLAAKESHQPALLICTDHEEVGSLSTSGANGPFLEDVLQRLSPNPEHFVQAINRSMLISADNSHGLHPNYSAKHDKLHAPMINSGAVIKVNSNQRYATNSETAGIYRDLAKQEGYEVQTFVVRSDMACGSTVGPIMAGGIGVPTIDIGLPTFGMHSIRELAGSEDAYGLSKVLARFINTPVLMSSEEE
ncbi:M18 family aminopeptidase [Marinomonas sp. 15G1-11]|uniref:M18 family aminopeptidase n=1 Tax=Marinomonas phaeophyticola TaxID=3004091 RepID=A0ABT4JQC0_9GAMM|nr:M18 family aminopeptidase [Marinomonas sp. 15G1-11]MCZ2720529.1 M18 family aminopeptidase [Marinomonas sp. 15G1-11]